MELRFNEFIKERRYLKGVSERTIDWYEDCISAGQHQSDGNDYKNFIISLRNKGTSAISVKTYICDMNAYSKWAGENLKIDYLKEEQKILASLSPEAISRPIRYAPKGNNLRPRSRRHRRALRLRPVLR